MDAANVERRNLLRAAGAGLELAKQHVDAEAWARYEAFRASRLAERYAFLAVARRQQEAFYAPGPSDGAATGFRGAGLLTAYLAREVAGFL